MPVVIVLFLLGAFLPAQKPDLQIEIGVLPGRLRFATEEFTVAPGSRVRLTLVNNDAMLHNLLICKRGKQSLDKVIAGAAALGAKGMERHFVPALPEVLFHTKVVASHGRQSIEFTAPTQRGAYPYVCTLPGHTLTMRGLMHVGSRGLRGLRYKMYAGSFDKLPEFVDLVVEKQGAVPTGILDLGVAGRRTDFALRFEGQLSIPRTGRYRFFLDSDDGARLYLGDKLVCDRDGVHGFGKEAKAELDLPAGPLQLRLDYFQKKHGLGLRLAWSGPGVPRQSLARRTKKTPRGLPLMVMEEPRVLRVHVEGAGPRSIACGLPGGVHCVFDAERCCVAFAWAGAFLDVGPDRLGRGGKPCKTLGPRFGVGGDGFAVSLGGKPQPLRFAGYRVRPWPEFEIRVGSHLLHWQVRPAREGIGLSYRWRLPGLDPAARVVLRLGADAAARVLELSGKQLAAGYVFDVLRKEDK